jgi:hypothetical protein
LNPVFGHRRKALGTGFGNRTECFPFFNHQQRFGFSLLLTSKCSCSNGGDGAGRFFQTMRFKPPENYPFIHGGFQAKSKTAAAKLSRRQGA